MCGIFGVVERDGSGFTAPLLEKTVGRLFALSESRGREAAGVAALVGDAISVYKDALPAAALKRRPDYRALMRQACAPFVAPGGGTLARTIMGHSRLVTDGSEEAHHNNQPVIADGIVGIHNGIVVNVADLWKRFPSITRRYEIDTEIILALVGVHLREGLPLVGALGRTFGLIRGAASVALMFSGLDCMALATNNGSLYTCIPRRGGSFIFASERYILTTLLKDRSLRRALGEHDIAHIGPGTGCLVDLGTCAATPFALARAGGSAPVPCAAASRPREIRDLLSSCRRDGATPPPRPESPSVWIPGVASRYPTDEEGVAALRRCTRCILPETMPFIDFDEAGVCSYCRHYSPLREKGREALEDAVAPHRSAAGEPDCVVGVSGGRDSTYGLHYLTTVLGMHPIAYTYDWGMVTDLARRNISRVCGKLGIENILVSADIPKKRRYIRMNVQAWLKRPALGMIPLFMAGDKQYFYYAKKVREQAGVGPIFLCENMMERTDFKWGFAGIPPAYLDEDHVYTISPADKLRIAGYYAGQYLRNPAYLNASLWDTLFAYACYYLIRRDYLNLYRFIRWDEKTIIRTLVDEYDWEVAGDTRSTWRIGDGTASFYNYIYRTVAGFSEIDTLRSNQIRERLLARDRALELSREENRPRFESIRWYCRIIGIDFEQALERINAIPRLYGRGGRRGPA